MDSKRDNPIVLFIFSTLFRMTEQFLTDGNQKREEENLEVLEKS